MKAWQLAVIVAIGAFLGSCIGAMKVYANHDTIPILADVAVAAGGECSFNKKGQMLKGGTINKPCLFGMSQSTGKWYAIIQDDMGMIVEVIEMNTETKKNTSVWRIKPKGQLGV